MSIDIDLFRATARSSPARWTSVRFTWVETHGGEPGMDRRRAWVRRIGDLRVESMDGGLQSVERERGLTAPGSVMEASAMSVSASPGEGLTRHHSYGVPLLRPDGLVAAWPDRSFYDDSVPMYVNYTWVAMLEPFELADGSRGDTVVLPGETPPDLSPLIYGEVREVDHHGRPALEAVVRTTDAYNPRCGCCPLLDGAEALAIEEAGYGSPLPGFADGRPRPDATAFRVRLDRGTGICVFAEALDGSYDAWGHDVTIEQVDHVYRESVFGRLVPHRDRRAQKAAAARTILPQVSSSSAQVVGTAKASRDARRACAADDRLIESRKPRRGFVGPKDHPRHGRVDPRRTRRGDRSRSGGAGLVSERRFVYSRQAQKDAKKLATSRLTSKAQDLLAVVADDPFATPPR